MVARLARAVPPLRREVVEYMMDADSHVEHAAEQGLFLLGDGSAVRRGQHGAVACPCSSGTITGSGGARN